MSVQNDKKVSDNAIELRRLGYSYSDIARNLKISRASVCAWVKNVHLTESEKVLLQKNLKIKMEKGRQKAFITLRSRNIFKDKVAYEKAEKEFAKLSKDPFFMFGLGLCTTSGIKKGGTFQLSSSNPGIIDLVLLWLKKYLDIPKDVPKRRKQGASQTLILSRVEVVRRIIAWQKLTMRYYG